MVRWRATCNKSERERSERSVCVCGWGGGEEKVFAEGRVNKWVMQIGSHFRVLSSLQAAAGESNRLGVKDYARTDDCLKCRRCPHSLKAKCSVYFVIFPGTGVHAFRLRERERICTYTCTTYKSLTCPRKAWRAIKWTRAPMEVH